DPDRPGSERVKIFIEPVPGADLDGDTVSDHLDGRVHRQAMPKEIELVDEIPLTDVGKINKQALRDDEADV
ncbi:MAG: AMP-dependent synthetase, partial [Natronomonas sp.]